MNIFCKCVYYSMLCVLMLTTLHFQAFADEGSQANVEPITSSHAVSYMRGKSGNIFVAWRDGHIEKFVKDDGRFISLETGNVFEEYQPAKYVLKTENGMVYYFDSPIHKRVTGLKDTDNNILIFDYNAVRTVRMGTFKDPMVRPQPTPTGGGGSGGGESKPLKNSQPSYFRQFHFINPIETSISPEKTSFLDAILGIFVGGKVYADTLDEPLVILRDILPTEGPAGTTAISITPPLPYEFSEKTVDTAAVDFVDSESSLNLATVFAIKTIHEPYDHDYPICNRFNGYTLESAAALPLPEVVPGITETPYFWYAATTKNSLVEETFIFAVFVSEETKTFTVDSHWLSHQYLSADSFDYDYIFNFQIWASSSEEAYKLLNRTLTNLSETGPDWKVVFANTIEPVAPTVMSGCAKL